MTLSPSAIRSLEANLKLLRKSSRRLVQLEGGSPELYRVEKEIAAVRYQLRHRNWEGPLYG